MKFLRLVLAGPELVFTQYGIYVISGPHMAYCAQNLPHVRQPFTIDLAHLPVRVTQALHDLVSIDQGRPTRFTATILTLLI